MVEAAWEHKTDFWKLKALARMQSDNIFWTHSIVLEKLKSISKLYVFAEFVV